MKIKTLFYILFILLGSQHAYSQKKDLPIFNRFTISDDNGTKRVFYADNLDYRTVSDKTYTWYASNTLHTTMGGYSGKLLYGQYTEFYPNKNLAERGPYAFGMKDGIWKTWYSNGNLKKESQWLAGIQEGPFVEYQENGQWIRRGHYKNNHFHGIIEEQQKDSVATLYFMDGKIISKEDYTNTNIFRKSKKLIGDKINQWFRKKEKQEVADMPQTS
ncbi:hypothetical protein LZQ00_10045 [Sphingobacterium sp. SRCM116780]|uniref:toxin-antitoxin system YwqK family antitoxin n=1 Tax=Sphingobacterium sp. SRCM116780 TaxID=2907623 RepID=UPI001F2F20B0|nr:hypothetical protein [Sphingobacterium sp. SRCM116780]UIR54615.1 hypothetical protein LZQ00_10045 [Sphingobacterium sp. SRCM116780]